MHCFELHIIMSQGFRSYGTGTCTVAQVMEQIAACINSKELVVGSTRMRYGVVSGWGGGGVHRLNSESLGMLWGERGQKIPSPLRAKNWVHCSKAL